MKTIKPLNFWEKFGDFLMTPLMYLLAGTFKESPQRTHPWNNLKLAKSEVIGFNKKMMVHCNGKVTAMKNHNVFLFHAPVLKGWKDYVVLQPEFPFRGKWHVGWSSKIATGVSLIPISNKVRLLIGPGDISFFAIDLKTHTQIPLKKIGSGRIGKRNIFSKIPLL